MPDRDSAAPSDEPGVAVIGDVVSLLGMADLFSDFFGGLALAGSGPGFIHGDENGRERRAVHAGQVEEFAMGIGDRDHDGLLHQGGFFKDEVDGLLGFGMGDVGDGSHTQEGYASTRARERSVRKQRTGQEEGISGPVSGSLRLEVQLQTELDETGKVDGVGDLTEVPAAEGSVRGAELGVVKEVEELCSEFKIDSFCDRGFLEHRKVEIDDTLLSQGGIDTCLVAEAVASWRRKAAGVEPCVDPGKRTTTVGLMTAGYHVGTKLAGAETHAGQQIAAAVTDFDGETALESGYAIQPQPETTLLAAPPRLVANFLPCPKGKSNT